MFRHGFRGFFLQHDFFRVTPEAQGVAKVPYYCVLSRWFVRVEVYVRGPPPLLQCV